jgi:lysophospholipase
MAIAEDIKPLNAQACGEQAGSVQTYYKHYGLDIENNIGGIAHYFGTFRSGEETLAGHIWKPAESKATVVILHGYLNHCGQFKHIARNLLENGYSVAAYDMVGHGLSTGKRGDIDNFSDYQQAIEDFKTVAETITSGPFHLIGFSTGGAIAVEHMLTGKDVGFEKIILCAPLIRSAGWKASKVGVDLYSKFADSIPRVARKNCSNEEYLKFNKTKDVLHLANVPFNWVRAMHRWNEWILDFSPSQGNVLLIQGTKDTTVSWKYNMKFLEEKFPNVKIEMVKDAGHELFNESPEYRQQIFSHIVNYLENSKGLNDEQ